MSFILSIDTTGATAMVVLDDAQGYYSERINSVQKDHARFLHPAINELLKEAGITVNDLAAISVAAGPGSYTGIRVGFAAAKGLAFAAGKPLISISSLKIMTASLIHNEGPDIFDLYCPMIDARRNEVFTALYNHDLDELLPAQPVIISPDFLASVVKENTCVFFGSGSEKLKMQFSKDNVFFASENIAGESFAKLSRKYFEKKSFVAVATAMPLYSKEFQVI